MGIEGCREASGHQCEDIDADDIVQDAKMLQGMVWNGCAMRMNEGLEDDRMGRMRTKDIGRIANV